MPQRIITSSKAAFFIDKSTSARTCEIEKEKADLTLLIPIFALCDDEKGGMKCSSQLFYFVISAVLHAHLGSFIGSNRRDDRKFSREFCEKSAIL